MFLERSIHRPSRHFAASTPAWLFAVIFAAGVAVGTVLPSGNPFHRAAPAAAVPAPAGNSAAPTIPAGWSRDGNPAVRHAAEVVRVIDGDTFEARVHLWPGLEMVTRVRLRGIDAPEMKGACADEMQMAGAATEALRALLADGDVAIFNIGPDKYNGRVVADASTRRTPSVSTVLLASNHARPYQGGRRGGWCGVNLRAG